MVLPVILFTVTLVAINCSSKDVKDNDKPEEEKAIAKKMEKQLDQSLATNPKLTPDSEFVEHLQKLKQKIVEDADPDNKIFDKTEINAMFPGGQREWQDFLVKNLNPNIPVDKGAPEGTYKVMLQFIVDRNGNISDLKPLTHFGYGMEEEVVRVMKLSPNWSPAIQNGKTVKAYTKQPITFAITAE
jgi:protein TonB